MNEGSFIREFVAGNAGGLAGIVTVYPLDTLKIRQQTYPNSGTMKDVFLEMKKQDGVNHEPHYNIFPILEQVKSLYRGMLSPALGFGLTFAGLHAFQIIATVTVVFSFIQVLKTL